MKQKPVFENARKTQGEVTSEELARVQRMMKQPRMQSLRGSLSFTMKHKGEPSKVK